MIDKRIGRFLVTASVLFKSFVNTHAVLSRLFHLVIRFY